LNSPVLFYLDSDARDNHDLTDKQNRIFRKLQPFFIIGVFVIHIIIATNTKSPLLSVNLIPGLILICILLLQPKFYKIYGRKHIKFTDKDLSIKLNYFKPGKLITATEIAVIEFDGNEFIISFQSADRQELKFKAGLESYESLRTKFRLWTDKNRIEIIE